MAVLPSKDGKATLSVIGRVHSNENQNVKPTALNWLNENKAMDPLLMVKVSNLLLLLLLIGYMTLRAGGQQ